MQNGEREQNIENNYYKGETRKKDEMRFLAGACRFGEARGGNKRADIWQDIWSCTDVRGYGQLLMSLLLTIVLNLCCDASQASLNLCCDA